jgi:cyclophilin family peptidyl-prolyl cis-trans isomerase
MLAVTPVVRSSISAMSAQPHLDGMHTVFGLTGNMDVVLALKNGSRIHKVTIQD